LFNGKTAAKHGYFTNYKLHNIMCKIVITGIRRLTFLPLQHTNFFISVAI
jgi:hypothetical protein